jgi:RimJ/RimL family protein N-acetyltransferase
MATSPSPILIDIPERFETNRLLVRCPHSGDGQALFEAVSESLAELRQFPASMMWATHPPSIASSETYCREAHSKFLMRQDMPFFAFRRDTGQMVCATGLHRPDWTVPKFEIGFWRRTSARSCGFVTEVVRGLIEFALTQIDARCIEAYPDDRNLPSCAVCERVGMKLEGTLRHERKAPDGSLRDTRVYALVR